MGSDGSDGEGGGGLGASRGVGRAQDACDAQHWHVPRNKSGAADVQHVMVALVSRVHGTEACDGLREVCLYEFEGGTRHDFRKGHSQKMKTFFTFVHSSCTVLSLRIVNGTRTGFTSIYAISFSIPDCANEQRLRSKSTSHHGHEIYLATPTHATAPTARPPSARTQTAFPRGPSSPLETMVARDSTHKKSYQ